MKKYLAVFASVLVLGLSHTALANCAGEEVRFTFDELKVRSFFELIADFAGLRLQIDPEIVQSGPVNFDCTYWLIAAENIAREYNLTLKINNGVMYVSKTE